MKTSNFIRKSNKINLINAIKNVLILCCSVFILSSFSLFSDENKDSVKGWGKAGNKPNAYEIGIIYDSITKSKIGFIKSLKKSTGGFGTIMQSISAKNYLNKRVKFSVAIKTKEVNDWCGAWMRIDGEKQDILGFDNMQSRPIKGTNDWQTYSIVLDIPQNATQIAFGVLINETGQVFSRLNMGVFL